jgi:predicted dienelactone hydrolase
MGAAMTNLFGRTLALVSGLLLGAHAQAFQAGWSQLIVAGETTDAPATIVALYYPTQAAARAVPMGPFAPQIAIQAPPEPRVKGLILLSHGTGASELTHTTLAEGLAQRGYLVAALRHPGDNWQDDSMLKSSGERYFEERPRQATRVIDAILRDPQWKGRIAGDEHGPRVGAVGHSAGGYTVLALAGGQPDVSRIARHCATERSEDPISCSLGSRRESGTRTTVASASAESLKDVRVRAVVALAPLGAVLTAQSLASIRVPVAIYEAELDRFLVPRFHAEWIVQSLPGAELHRVRNAGHFAFADTPSMPLLTPDGDLGSDPPGFDRAAFLRELSIEIPAFFDKTLR